MGATIESILEAVRALPLEQRSELIARLTAEVSKPKLTEEEIQANLKIVEETHGTIKGLDRETLISLAEDEEYCGY